MGLFFGFLLLWSVSAETVLFNGEVLFNRKECPRFMQKQSFKVVTEELDLGEASTCVLFDGMAGAFGTYPSQLALFKQIPMPPFNFV